MLPPSFLFQLAETLAFPSCKPQLWTMHLNSCSSADAASRALLWLLSILNQLYWERCGGLGATLPPSGLGHGTLGSIGQESPSQGNHSLFKPNPAHSSTKAIAVPALRRSL